MTVPAKARRYTPASITLNGGKQRNTNKGERRARLHWFVGSTTVLGSTSFRRQIVRLPWGLHFMTRFGRKPISVIVLEALFFNVRRCCEKGTR